MAVLAPSPRSVAPSVSVLDPVAAERRRWLALVVLCIGQLMIVLDATVVNVALPSIQRDLHFSQASLAWVINGYLITFGGLLLLGGRLGDLLGRRRVFLAGLAAFTLASVLCGIAPGQELLVGARFLQGMGAATMSAMVLGILVTLFPTPHQTARAMSIYAFVASSGGAIGLLLGGVLTQALSWHWIFFINVPIGIVAGVLGFLLIPRHEGIGLRHGVDITGAVLVTAAPSLAIYAILQASEHGWATLETLLLFAGALLLAALFIRVESRVPSPLVPLRIFRSRNATGANLVRTLFPVGMFGSFFLGPLYLQHVLGYSAMRTGLAYLPQSALIGVVSILVVGRLVSRFGLRSTLIAGLSLVAAGLVLFARVPVQGNYVVDVLPVTLLLGFGAGLVFMPSATLSMAGAGPGDAGVLSGLANVAIQMGAALGVAVLAGVSASRTSSLLAQGVSQPAAQTSGFHLAFAISAVCLVAAIAVAFAVLRAAPRVPRPVVVVPPTAVGVE